MTKNTILIVDDDVDLCELMVDTLAESYCVEVCYNAASAREKTSSKKPSIIILDVNLLDSCGLSLCKELKNDFNYSPLILLVSGDGVLEQRLEAYNAGGADFLAKPFSVQELRAKVDILNTLFDKHSALENNNEFATKTAMNAMVEASQYGEVLRFYNDMYKADSTEKIKDSLFSLMSVFTLRCCVQFRTNETVSFDSENGFCSPIEEQIFESLHESDRLIPFENRMMTNGKFCSIIVKNMPIDDEINNGRLKDILATLIEGMDAKLLDVQRLSLLKQTSRDLAKSSTRLTQVMKRHETFFTGSMNNVISEINASFHSLEMTEDQESFFTKLCENVLQSMEESFVHVGNETDVLDCIRLSLAAMLSDREE